jgi:hypothetical protein
MSDPNNAALKRIGPTRNTGVGRLPGMVAVSESDAADVTTGQAAIDLSASAPSSLRGAYLTLINDGASSIYITFAPGSSIVTYSLSPTSRSGNDQAGLVLQAGQTTDIQAPPGATHLHHITAAGTSVLRLFVSSVIEGYSP